MIDVIVTHPLFGRGVVRELRNAGREASVAFDNGIRTVVPVTMLNRLDGGDALPAPRPALPKRPDPTTEQLRAYDSRRTVEALRYGIVPNRRIRELSVGLQEPLASLHRAFETVGEKGGDVRVVIGEYGSGKSHFFELAGREALDRDFLVATTSLDLQEVPPNRPQRIYNSLIKSLQFPDKPGEQGLVALLDAAVANPTDFAEILESVRGTVFATVLRNYQELRNAPGEALQTLLDWIMGEKVFIADVRKILPHRNADYPVVALSTMTTSADQYCYLLSGWGWIAIKLGYKGIALLIDESEHYSLLTQRGKERADNLFKGLIFSCMGDQPECRIHKKDLEHHHSKPHEFRLKSQSHLLALFALTPTVNSFNYGRWLPEDRTIPLGTRWAAGEVEELMSRLYVLHRQAYGYDRSEVLLDVSQGLLECLESRLINLRQMIRLAMEMYDRCFTHPDYSASEAVEEVRRALLGH